VLLLRQSFGGQVVLVLVPVLVLVILLVLVLERSNVRPALARVRSR
jgi:hypothetical protein